MQLASQRVFTGRVIGLDVDTVRYPDGTTGEMEIIRHPGAAAVVPIASDPNGADPTLLMIKQYRHAAGGTLWEIPAGRLGPNEDPATCARRELLEEVGVIAGRLEPLATIWTTPGFTDERIHLFWAADLKAGVHAREHDEFIEVAPRHLTDVLDGIRAGEICDGKTVSAILYLAKFTLRL